ANESNQVNCRNFDQVIDHKIPKRVHNRTLMKIVPRVHELSVTKLPIWKPARPCLDVGKTTSKIAPTKAKFGNAFAQVILSQPRIPIQVLIENLLVKHPAPEIHVASPRTPRLNEAAFPGCQIGYQLHGKSALTRARVDCESVEHDHIGSLLPKLFGLKQIVGSKLYIVIKKNNGIGALAGCSDRSISLPHHPRL